MKESTEVEKLEQAIAALEAQRQILGDQVVEVALTPLREKQAALRGNVLSEQRKLVTILFADLAGFTTLSARLDPEDVRELINAYFSAWKTCIETQGGVVEKFIGDAVMAVFGLPVAHEDDPERAIRAALSMRQKLEELNAALQPEQGVRLAMRVGINTGEVVVSTLGERQGEEFVVVGEPVNLGSRLQAAAPAGGILISHATYRHIRGVFNVSPLEPIQVKGVAEPLQVYLVREAKPRVFRMGRRGVEGIETPMIGREGELKRLQDAFSDGLETQERQVVTVVGEAGLGKSRLIDEFVSWLELLPETLYYFKGRAHSSTQNAPYSLVRDMFAFRFQIQDSDAPQTVKEKLELGVEQALGEAGRMKGHFIGHLLGFEFGESEHLQAVHQDVKGFHERSLVYLGDYFHALAQQNPVVVLLEDIHWADDSSLELINHLEGSLANKRLLIVCATRPQLFERRPHWGEGLPFHTRLDLNPLTKRQSWLLVKEILHKVNTVPDSLRELVVTNAEGNPYYIEELIKMLIEDGVIVKGEEQWHIEAGRLDTIRVPPTLTGVLQARFDSLTPEERRLLQQAAVVGRIFWDRAVEYLEGRRVEDEELEDNLIAGLLDKIRLREMIFQREKSTFEETFEYSFKHALLRDVTYESLLKRLRRIYHGYAARWLEEVTEHSGRSDEYAVLIAEHYERSGERMPAARWYQRAGRQAESRYANAEAVHAYSRALSLIPQEDAAWVFELLLRRAKVYDLQGDRQAQERDLEQLNLLASQLGDAARQATVARYQAEYAYTTGDFQAALEASQRAIDLSGGDQAGDTAAEGYLLHAGALMRQGEFQRSEEQTQRALDLARQNGLSTLEARSLRQLGLIAYYIGEPLKARDHFAQALDLFNKIGDRQGEGMALNNLGGANFNLGEYAQAAYYYQRSYQLCREIGDRAGEARGLNNLGIVSVAKGEYGPAEEYYLQSYQICREIGARSNEVSVLDNLGNLALYRYQFIRARMYQEKSLHVAEEIGDKVAGTYTLTNLGRGSLSLGDHENGFQYISKSLEHYLQLGDRQGECHARFNLSQYFYETGDYAAALAQCDQSLAISNEFSLRSEKAWSLNGRAYILAGLGRLEEAAEAYQQALEIRQDLGEPKEATETQAGLALALLDLGDLEQAKSHIEEVLSSFESGGAEGFEQPAQVYLACYRVLQAAGDPRTREILENGYRLLQVCAAQIDDMALRQSFLENVSANRALINAWRS